MRISQSLATTGFIGFCAIMGPPAFAQTAVGPIDAIHGVTTTGAAIYTVPIQATEGVGSLTPALAISYAGPATHTTLGRGFTISGLSMITRCPKTIVQDVAAGPITMTSTDAYCLDGSRLRWVSGTYGATGSVFRPEIDSLTRVTVGDSSAYNQPLWFKAELKSGLVYEYGRTVDSKLSVASILPIFWAINKISDRNGNSITFHYDANDTTRQFRPDYILYTDTQQEAAHYRISFIYNAPESTATTLDVTPSNAGGATEVEDRLLNRLELLHDGQIYRKYQFTYEVGAGVRKRLASIQECAYAPSEQCLLPTQFSWQPGTEGYGPQTNTYVVSEPNLVLDINGDGIEDVAWPTSGTWRYMFGGPTGYGSPINSTYAVTNPYKAIALDWNADGFMDLLVDWSDGKWRVLRGSASGLLAPVHAGPGTGIPSNTSNSSWGTADMDADGRDDLIRVDTRTNIPIGIYRRLNSSTGFGAEGVAYAGGSAGPARTLYAIGYSSPIRSVDINGDGREDIFLNIGNGLTPFLSTGTGYAIATPVCLQIDYAIPTFADFNNDGLTDVACYHDSSTNNWEVALSQGNGGWFSGGLGSILQSPFLEVAFANDHNGDGFHDLYTPNPSGGFDVYRGNGIGIDSTPSSTVILTGGVFFSFLTDFNGDGNTDFAFRDFGSGMWRVNTRLGLPADHLLSATDGLQNQISFSYLPMTNSSVYLKGTGSAYPTRDFQGSTPLVRTMTASPAGGISFSFDYLYGWARVNNQGRGFLGMQSMTVTDNRNGVKSIETYRQDFPYIGAVATLTVKQPSNTVIRSDSNTYAQHLLDATSGNQRVLPYRSQTVVNGYEVGGIKNGNWITQVTETRTVNTLGNTTLATSAVIDKDLGSSEYGQTYTTQIATAYSEDQLNWCLALPTSRSETRTLPGSIAETRATSWVVSGLQCRVSQETIEPGAGSAISLVTDFGYDSCGNTNSVSTYPAGLPAQARTTTLGYGTRCQRPETITNPESHVSTIAYNWSLALPSLETDPNGIFVNLEYDGFGRPTRQIRPDGTATRLALTACTAGNNWCGKSNSARVRVTRTERDTADGILRTNEQFLDGFGRVRWVHSDSLESGPAIVETLYDAFDMPSQQTLPYFVGGTVYATSYARDLLGRVTQINAPINEANTSGRLTGFAYEGREVKITDPRSYTTTRRNNVIGQLRAVVDPSPGGTTSYAYRPFGEIASIIDAATNITSWAYNQRGFLTGTGDPDAGSWTYLPNAFGETEKIRDAKTSSPNWSTQFTFDKLSRVITRVEGEGTTTWTWGNTAAFNNIGQLASIASPGSYSEGFSFDSLGRLIQQAVTADGTTYNVNLTYHAQTGLLDTLQYPTSTSGYRLKLAYDYSNNLLRKVRDFNGSTIFWQATSTDAFGHIQNEAFGNGVLTFTDFDQANGLMTAREGGIGGGTGLINSQTAWDLNGNLTFRRDLQQSPNVTEDIYYDSLNRFDYSQRTVGTGAPATNADVTLDAIGNISWKLGVGSYTYHATKKHAVINAGSNSFGYDANGNMNSRNGSSIGYTSYNLPNLTNAGSSASTISYGAFRNRFKQVSSGSIAETTIYVAGLLEKVTRGSVIEYRHLIAGGEGPAAIYTRRSNATNSTYYVHSDHLGSPELVTDSAGTVVVRLSFGAYGERRDKDWDGAVSAPDLTALANVSRHGFTGHEHLDAVGLIHMNGRVYEPVAGRFLGADPVMHVGLSQSPNRYAYVWNNPLTLIDPSGLDPPPEPPAPPPDCVRDSTGQCATVGVRGRRIGGECDWGGPWMAGWSEACLGEISIDEYKFDDFGGGITGEDAEPGDLVVWPVPGNCTLNTANSTTHQGGGAYGDPRPNGKAHEGIDISATIGTPVVAVMSGTIVSIQPNPSDSYGYQVVIDANSGRFFQYAHLQPPSVLYGTDHIVPGLQVHVGDMVGTVGRSGNVPSMADSHLHFEYRLAGKGPFAATSNPSTFLPACTN